MSAFPSPSKSPISTPIGPLDAPVLTVTAGLNEDDEREPIDAVFWKKLNEFPP